MIAVSTLFYTFVIKKMTLYAMKRGIYLPFLVFAMIFATVDVVMAQARIARTEFLCYDKREDAKRALDELERRDRGVKMRVFNAFFNKNNDKKNKKAVSSLRGVVRFHRQTNLHYRKSKHYHTDSTNYTKHKVREIVYNLNRIILRRKYRYRTQR